MCSHPSHDVRCLTASDPIRPLANGPIGNLDRTVVTYIWEVLARRRRRRRRRWRPRPRRVQWAQMQLAGCGLHDRQNAGAGLGTQGRKKYIELGDAHTGGHHSQLLAAPNLISDQDQRLVAAPDEDIRLGAASRGVSKNSLRVWNPSQGHLHRYQHQRGATHRRTGHVSRTMALHAVLMKTACRAPSASLRARDFLLGRIAVVTLTRTPHVEEAAHLICTDR